VKQGSKDTAVSQADDVHQIIAAATESAVQTYQDLLNSGVAPEVARTVLPQSMYTLFWETASLYAYARLCNLRLDPSAQKEIRLYATIVHEMLLEKFPVSWAALMQ